MDPEELEPRKKVAIPPDLDRMSIEELKDYIAAMEEEILRVREAIVAKRKQRGGAESLFKR